MTKIKFDPVGGNLIKIPVLINGSISTFFLIDTGAGINAISERLCKKIAGKKMGMYSGKRMSGEQITLSFSSVENISIGNDKYSNIRVGVTDIFDKLPKELGEIDGALSLRFFEERLLTIDYRNYELKIGGVMEEGSSVPIHLDQDNEKIISFVNVDNYGLFEIDTGNSLTVINLDLAKQKNIDLHASGVKKIEGKNETGFPFVAFYTSLDQLCISGTKICQINPTVAFKELIHSGVLGNNFFNNQKITFDILNKRIIFH